MKYLLIIAIVIAVIVLAPFATIWSINTLFGLTIPFTFDTWCASLILGGVVSGQSFLSFKK
jgi:hypothetical protein